MDTIDRSDSNLPAPFPNASSLLPSLAPVYSSELATTPTSQINPRTLLRGLARHWWHILLAWLAISAPIAYAIQWFVKPTYEAVSLLRIEPNKPELYGQQQSGNTEYRGVATYLSTQATLILSEWVLNEAVNGPLVRDLPWITKSDDPTTDLRNLMLVEVVPDSFLIRVSLELPDATEAATIVNAVVQSYIAFNANYLHSANSQLKKNLGMTLTRLASEITAKKTELRELYAKGNLEANNAELNLGTSKTGDEATRPTVNTLSDQHYQAMVQAMVNTDLELVEARANLDVVEAAIKAQGEGKEDLSKQVDRELEPRIKEEFQKDPEVISLIQEIKTTEEHLDHAKAAARQGHDPARRAAEKQFKKLNDEYISLWQQKYKEISERLKRTAVTSQSPSTMNELKIRVDILKKKRDDQVALFKQLKSDKKQVTNDAFQASFLNLDVASLLRKEESVNSTLQQLEFDDTQETYRVIRVDEAKPTKTPLNNKKIKYMLAAPTGVLFMVLGLFLLLEVTSGRVADPDSLSTRVRSEVYALPPLPTPRAVRGLGAPKAEDQIDQFIQRLDHLRFAVCGNPGGLGKGRCVLITSAVGGEGKTTLAAQLAARCGNAGMSTLLIDADLRRSELCTLLDVPEGPGLSDVLKDEATIEDVVMPVQEGTFYLLRTGTAIRDTSRVLQSPNFGLLITHVRQLYDLIIIDSPPVLPVPDALILGRWADGAVLAARFDISRFTRVERARRQLDNAGIAILGTVINGMRNTDSYYGRYSHKRRESSQTNSTSTI